MNQAHLHLLFNHLPIITPFIGLTVLIAGLLLKSTVVQRTAFGIFILGALTAIPAAATGEGAEEIVEEIAGTSHKLIHDHEEQAEVFAVLCYLLGAISIVGFWASLKEKKFARLLSFIIIAVCAIVLYFAKQTGTSGGEIRHTEISGAPLPENHSESESD